MRAEHVSAQLADACPGKGRMGDKRPKGLCPVVEHIAGSFNLRVTFFSVEYLPFIPLMSLVLVSP